MNSYDLISVICNFNHKHRRCAWIEILKTFYAAFPFKESIFTISSRYSNRSKEENITHLSTKKSHAKDIQSLTLHILGPHVHNTLQTKPCTYSGCCNTMLSRTCLSYYPFLPYAFGKKCLSNGIVDLVGTSVIKIFPFQIDVWSSI